MNGQSDKPVLLIVGNDSFSIEVAKKVKGEFLDSVLVCQDRSTDIRRVLKLVLKGRLKLSALVKMAIAEVSRRKETFSFDTFIRTNAELLSILNSLDPSKVVCFRCGLVINKSVLSTGVPIYNTHCSSLPEYPGIGTIYKTISEGAWKQSACLHLIDEGIDTGQVIQRSDYVMKKSNSYKANEDLAYATGISLVLHFLRRSKKTDDNIKMVNKND